MKKILFALIIIFISIDSFAQKTDVRVEIFDLKEQVAKLISENQRISDELRLTTTKNENRILDLGVKIEDLKFEINVLKRIVEDYRNGEKKSNSNVQNSTSNQVNSSKDDSSNLTTESKSKATSYSQCSATTKKGVRCSRAARSNGLCWQHGG